MSSASYSKLGSFSPGKVLSRHLNSSGLTYSVSISPFLVIVLGDFYLQVGEGDPPLIVLQDEFKGLWSQIRQGLDCFQH